MSSMSVYSTSIPVFFVVWLLFVVEIETGIRVRLDGYDKRWKYLNYKEGTIMGFLDSRDRWAVQLDDRSLGDRGGIYFVPTEDLIPTPQQVALHLHSNNVLIHHMTMIILLFEKNNKFNVKSLFLLVNFKIRLWQG